MFNNTFFKNNRDKLIKALPESLIVITANSQLQYSADEPYEFRQDSSFWYLTGVNNPELILIIDTKNEESTIIPPTQNSYQIEWDGKLNLKEISNISGIKKFESFEKINDLLINAKKTGKQICTLMPLPEIIEPYGFYSNPARKKLLEIVTAVEQKPKDIRINLAVLRQNKQKEEIEQIKKAISITAASLNDIKNNIGEYETEKEIATKLQIQFLTYGADGHKFDPIVASGKNAATIHYKDNNKKLTEGSLVLLDVGAKIGMYGADISRTWAYGKATNRQKEIYKHLLNVHFKALSRVKPGVTIKELQEATNIDIEKICKKLKISHRNLPHGLSHFLGIDTHDAGDYSQPLSSGDVITIEPGIYLPDESIGVRIEDDVLVTDSGSEVLSKDISYDL